MAGEIRQTERNYLHWNLTKTFKLATGRWEEPCNKIRSQVTPGVLFLLGRCNIKSWRMVAAAGKLNKTVILTPAGCRLLKYTQHLCLKDVANHLEVLLKCEGEENQLLDKTTKHTEMWLLTFILESVGEAADKNHHQVYDNLSNLFLDVLGSMTLSRRSKLTTVSASSLVHYDLK